LGRHTIPEIFLNFCEPALSSTVCTPKAAAVLPEADKQSLYVPGVVSEHAGRDGFAMSANGVRHTAVGRAVAQATKFVDGDRNA
jgi:hypothetical protein